MNRRLRNSLTCLVASFMISAMLSLTMLNGVLDIFTEDNIEKCLSSIDIKKMLTSQNTDYNQVISNYVNDTNMSKEDIQKVFESSEYSSLIGNYVLDSDMINLSEIFNGTNIEDSANIEDITNIDGVANAEDGKKPVIDTIMTKDDIKKVFDKVGVNYTESDINYFKNSLTTDVVPKIETEIDNILEQNTGELKNSNINIDGIKNVFSKKTISTNKIIIFICAVIILLLNYKNVAFFSVYAINSTVVAIILKIFDVLINRLINVVPKEYNTMIGVFTKPLLEQLSKDINTLIWVIIICILLQVIMHILINKTQLGDNLVFLKYGKSYESEEDNYKSMYNNFNDDYGTLADSIDFSQFDECSNDDSAYDSNELKDITFSTGTYVHKDVK